MKKVLLIMMSVIIGVMAVGCSDIAVNDTTINTESATEAEEITVYEAIDLSVMLDDLKANAMKAKEKYENKYIEVKGKIKNFDSSGKYISVEPTDADEWNFDTAMCYIKDENQKTFLIEKNVGDIVTIKGKVSSIGEVLGYSIDIDEVQ